MNILPPVSLTFFSYLLNEIYKYSTTKTSADSEKTNLYQFGVQIGQRIFEHASVRYPVGSIQGESSFSQTPSIGEHAQRRCTVERVCGLLASVIVPLFTDRNTAKVSPQKTGFYIIDSASALTSAVSATTYSKSGALVPQSPNMLVPLHQYMAGVIDGCLIAARCFSKQTEVKIVVPSSNESEVTVYYIVSDRSAQ